MAGTCSDSASKARRIQSPNGYVPGQDQNTPVWWVSVQGYFQFQGMPAPGITAGNLYEADERIFIYDARTGEAIGSQIRHSRSVTASPGPAVSADMLPPCPPPVPTLPPNGTAPIACRGAGPSAKLYDRDRQASPPPSGVPVPTRQSYALTPGPQTCGATIHIAGRTIQLPPDACVTSYEPYVQCTAGQSCPDPPIYELPEERHPCASKLDPAPSLRKISCQATLALSTSFAQPCADCASGLCRGRTESLTSAFVERFVPASAAVKVPHYCLTFV